MKRWSLGSATSRLWRPQTPQGLRLLCELSLDQKCPKASLGLRMGFSDPVLCWSRGTVKEWGQGL